ncbi:MAG: hypothetical protein K2R98_13455 [Gemmataceae bacterium]|nr:hypothetical protein [Gemmataceae bacterium]
MKRSPLALLGLGLLAVTSWGEEPAALKIHMLGAGEYKPVESLTAYKKHLEATSSTHATVVAVKLYVVIGMGEGGGQQDIFRRLARFGPWRTEYGAWKRALPDAGCLDQSALACGERRSPAMNWRQPRAFAWKRPGAATLRCPSPLTSRRCIPGESVL